MLLINAVRKHVVLDALKVREVKSQGNAKIVISV
jgi:hypothetical protein